MLHRVGNAIVSHWLDRAMKLMISILVLLTIWTLVLLAAKGYL